jgi:hydrophobic/amphiphilic exporter-1 (mainly G- bacteria), HAE1 family
MQKLLANWLKRPVSFIVLNLIIIILGAVSLINLPLELSPSLEFPKVTIYTFYPNSTPEMIEALITAPIESRIQQVPAIRDVRSVSAKNISQVTITFERGTDMKFAGFQLNEILADYKSWLPREILRPQVQKYIPEELEKESFLTYRFLSNLPDEPLHRLLNDKIKRSLLNIPGVAAVDISGIREPVVEILLNTEKMNLWKINISDIRQIINPKNINSGLVKKKDSVYPLIVKQRFASLTEMENIPVKVSGARIIRLKDIARVQNGYERLRFKKRINGRETALIQITKESTANTITVADAVFATIAKLEKGLPSGNDLLLVDDASKKMRQSLKDLALRSMISFLGIILLLIFGMRQFKAPIIIVSAILLAILLTFFGISSFGLTINLLTIAGIALGFGFMVDNAILIYDNIDRNIPVSILNETQRGEKAPHQHQQLNHNKDAKAGNDAKKNISQSVSEIAPPIIAATLTTLAALAPFVFLSGELRLYYLPFAIVLSLTLAASVLFSFFYVPAAYKHFKWAANKSKAVRNKPSRLTTGYEKGLKYLIKRRRVLYAVILWGFGLPLWLLPGSIDKAEEDGPITTKAISAYNALIGTSFYSSVREYSDPLMGGILYIFFNEIDRGTFWRWRSPTYLSVYLRLPQGSAPGLSESNIIPFEQLALAGEGISKIETSIWQSGASLRIDFEDDYALTAIPFRLKEVLIARAAKMSGLIVSVTGYGDGFSAGMVGGTSSSFTFNFKGYNYKDLEKLAIRFKNKIMQNRRIRNVDINARFGYSIDDLNFLNGALDKKALASKGFTLSDILPLMQLYTSEYLVANRVIIDQKERKLRLKAAAFQDFDMDRLSSKPFHKDGKLFRFSEFISIDKQPVANEIHRENQQYSRMVSFDFLGPYRFAYQFIEKIMTDFAVPVGYSIERRTFFKEDEKKESELYFVIFLGILLIYMVTAALYESFRDPFLIFLTIPSGLLGIVLVFYFLDAHFGQSAYIGVIFISGIVVNNSILLVNRFNQNLKGGRAVVPSILKGASDHLRPLTLTTLTTIVGFLPLVVFSSGNDENIWYALSLAGIGGIVSSSLFILFVLPIMFYSAERQK